MCCPRPWPPPGQQLRSRTLVRPDGIGRAQRSAATCSLQRPACRCITQAPAAWCLTESSRYRAIKDATGVEAAEHASWRRGCMISQISTRTTSQHIFFSPASPHCMMWRQEMHAIVSQGPEEPLTDLTNHFVHSCQCAQAQPVALCHVCHVGHVFAARGVGRVTQMIQWSRN